MATTWTTPGGGSALSRYVDAALGDATPARVAALREEAYRDGWTWGEIDRAMFEARLRREAERTDALVRRVEAAIDGVPEGARYLLDNGGPGYPDEILTTFATFAGANPDMDEEVLDAVRALGVGETYHGDEGAGGTWTLTRIA